jgi:hypothetical protein
MKAKILSVLSILLIALLSATSMAIPVGIDQIKIDGTNVEDDGQVRLDVQRGQEIEIELTLVPTEDVEDIEIRAFISGYEYNGVDEIADSIGPLSMDKDVKYKKTLTVTLPEDVEESDYKLRLLFTDRNGEDVMVKNYQIKVDLPRHQIQISDVLFNPSKNVKAGSALLGQVRLENMGEKTEEDVIVKIMIPELGVSATDYIDEIESGEQEETEELYLRIPENAAAGMYQAQVYVGYNSNHDKVLATGTINVEAKATEAPQEAAIVVQEPVVQPTTEAVSTSWKSAVRTGLEIVLLVLVALLVVIGLIIGFTRLGKSAEY